MAKIDIDKEYTVIIEEDEGIFSAFKVPGDVFIEIRESKGEEDYDTLNKLIDMHYGSSNTLASEVDLDEAVDIAKEETDGHLILRGFYENL